MITHAEYVNLFKKTLTNDKFIKKLEFEVSINKPFMNTNITTEDIPNLNLIIYAFNKNDTINIYKILQIYLSNGFDPNTLLNFSIIEKAPLLWYIIHQLTNRNTLDYYMSYKCAKLLLEHNANPNIYNESIIIPPNQDYHFYQHSCLDLVPFIYETNVEYCLKFYQLLKKHNAMHYNKFKEREDDAVYDVIIGALIIKYKNKNKKLKLKCAVNESVLKYVPPEVMHNLLNYYLI